MADTIKSSAEVKWTLQFVDGDTRTISVDSPKSDLTLADLESAMSTIGTIFSGDVAGAAYAGFTDAKKITTTTQYYDLS